MALLSPFGAAGAPQDSLGRLPDAPVKQLIASKCASACHDAGHALDRPRTREEWTDTVVLMRDYGADVSFDEQKEIVDYLAKNMGRAAPAKPATPPPVPATAALPASSNAANGRTSARSQSAQAPAIMPAGEPASSGTVKPASAAGAGSATPAPGGLPPGAGKDLVQTKCTMCHNLDRVIGSHRTRAEWQQLVITMQEYGADVYGDEETAVVNYLAKSFPAAGGSSKGAAGSGGPGK